MSSFVLKLIAIFTMFCDHIGDAVYSSVILNYIGRIAFPIFAFQLAQGFIHTSNRVKYFVRLLVFAAISQIPFYLFTQKFGVNVGSLNIFFTLLLGFVCMAVYQWIMDLHFDKKTHSGNELITEKQSLAFFNEYYIKKIIAVFVCLGIAYIGDLIHVDYGLWGVLVIFSFYLFKDNKLAMLISFITLVVIKYGNWIIQYGFHYQYVLLCLFTVIPAFLIAKYNGEKGKSLKYLFYAFYPLHLLLIYLFL